MLWYCIQQECKQDLQTFVAQTMISVGKASTNIAAMTDLIARQAFLKGCDYQTEALTEIRTNRCSSLDERVGEMHLSFEYYSILVGKKDDFYVRAFQPSPNLFS